MNHTVSGRDYQRLWFNGVEVGETGINAALCGTWGCPVLLVTGDEASCAEGKALLGDGVTTVAVKRALGSASARDDPSGPGARDDRGGREDGARGPEGGRRPTTPAAPARSRSSSSARSRPTGSASTPASSASTGARSASRPAPGGRPGGCSSSRPRPGGRRDDPELLDEREERPRERRVGGARADESQSICSRSERASSSTRRSRVLLGEREQLRRQHVAERGDRQSLRRHLDLLGALEVAVVESPPAGQKMRSTASRRPRPSAASPPAAAPAACPRRRAPPARARRRAGRTRKSTSCSVGGPPRAQAASPPPSRNGTPASRSAAAARFIVSISSGKSRRACTPSSAPVPAKPVCESASSVNMARDGRDDPRCRRRRHPLRRAAARARSRARSPTSSGDADLVLLAGDLTTHGEPEQAARARRRVPRRSTLPVFAVLGNHDYHANRSDEVIAVLEEAGVMVLAARLAVPRSAGSRSASSAPRGSSAASRAPSCRTSASRCCARSTPRRRARSRRSRRGLEAIAGCHRRIVLLHYAPILETLEGEPETIWAFLGSAGSPRPIGAHRPDLVLHGHAHRGTFAGELGPVPVRNVAVHVIGKDF